MEQDEIKSINLLAEHLIQTDQVGWHIEDDICDMGDDGDGYVAYKTQTLVIDYYPKVFSEDFEHYQELLEEIIYKLISEGEFNGTD